MRCWTLTLGLGLGVICGSVTQAGWPEFWHRVHIDYRRSVCWPEPFSYADRSLARSPFAQMVDNGWRMENTLNDHLFALESNQLNRAGELKVHWIATQAPAARRTVYVLRGATEEVTNIRIQSVNNYIATLSLRSGPPAVMQTEIVPYGGSGEYIDQIDRRLRESIPDPRLPTDAGAGGAGS